MSISGVGDIRIAARQLAHSDHAIVIALQHAAEDLPPPEHVEAFSARFERYGDASVVLLGEATHGTSEFYRARAAISRHLIQNCGFNILAVEADWPDASGAGSNINLSSIYGLVGAADVPPYHASKGAVRLMTKTDALIYASDKIRVNSIHPGFIGTPMVESYLQATGNPNQARKAIDALHPLGHIGEPDDIAWGAVYLASDEAKFVTGAELVIDGGYTAQ
jgi:NAD(P)-dependent dehydrogenase (short-subunit alcohol dehydrogenase family)